MELVTYTALRQNLSSWLDKVTENHAPLLVTRQNGMTAVLLSFEDFKSYEETAYLAASPKNRERLSAAIEALRSGKGKEYPLSESDV